MNLWVHKKVDATYLIGHLQERKHGATISAFGNGIIYNPKQTLHSFIYNPSLISYYPLFNRGTFTIRALNCSYSNLVATLV